MVYEPSLLSTTPISMQTPTQLRLAQKRPETYMNVINREGLSILGCMASGEQARNKISHNNPHSSVIGEDETKYMPNLYRCQYAICIRRPKFQVRQRCVCLDASLLRRFVVS